MSLVKGARPGSKTASSPTYRITTARKSIADDQASRVRGYVVSMSIRIACFALAVVTDGVWRWLFVAGALLIPYIAVVFANGGREPAPEMPDALRPFGERELPAAPPQGPSAADR